MSDDKTDGIQKQIDSIDAEMYNLLMQRTELVKQLADGNAVENSLGNEAAVIKKLLRSHKGDFPEYVVAKIWREILTASAFLNDKLKISLYGQEHDNSLANIVQDHFGSYVDYETYSSFGQVMNALTSHDVQLAVIPCDNCEINQKPWWSALSAAPNGERLQIIAKLPFIRRKEAKDSEEVYVISMSETDKSGSDISLLSVEVASDVSSSTVVDIFENAGFKGVKVICMAASADENKSCLLEVNGYLKNDDERLGRLDEAVKSLSIVGAYAQPVSL